MSGYERGNSKTEYVGLGYSVMVPKVNSDNLLIYPRCCYSHLTESTNTDGLPRGPNTISGQQALGGPVLARITTVECLREGIRLTIPKEIIDYFGQASDMSIMMLDPSCKAHADGSDLVLEMELDGCGTTKIVEDDRVIFENEVRRKIGGLLSLRNENGKKWVISFG